MLSTLLGSFTKWLRFNDFIVYSLFRLFVLINRTHEVLKCIHQKFEYWSATELIISCNWSQALIFHFVFLFCHTKKYVSKWWFNLILSFNKNTCTFFVAAYRHRWFGICSQKHTFTIWSILFDIKRDPIGDVELYCCFGRMHQQCHAKNSMVKKSVWSIVSSAADVVHPCKRKRDQEFIYASKRDCSLFRSLFSAHRTCLRSHNTILQFLYPFWQEQLSRSQHRSADNAVSRIDALNLIARTDFVVVGLCVCVCPNTQISLK